VLLAEIKCDGQVPPGGSVPERERAAARECRAGM